MPSNHCSMCYNLTQISSNISNINIKLKTEYQYQVKNFNEILMCCIMSYVRILNTHIYALIFIVQL